MKTTEFLSKYRSIKEMFRELSRKVMLTRMVADNLRDVVPTAYKIDPVQYSHGIMISPVDPGLSVDNFPKMTKKLAKILHRKPSIDITPELMTAVWWTYPTMGEIGRTSNQIRIELVFGNTEKCELIPTKVTVESFELSGYCKQIKEMEYDIN